MSLDDFFALPDKNTGKRELIEGEVIELPPAKAYHSTLAELIGDQLREYLKSTGERRYLVRVEAGFEFRAAKRSWLQPDISVLYPNQKVGADGYYWGAPQLAIEIVSKKNTRREIERKRQIYLENGAKEVWAVFRRMKGIEAARTSQPGVIRYQHTLTSPLFPGLVLDLDALFEAEA
jgi:Uma2 family endonuclease